MWSRATRQKEGSRNISVTLTVTSGAGCTSTSTQAVTVWAGPNVAFAATPVDGCAPLLVSLDNQSFGDGLSYTWDLGDGSSTTAEEPGAHSYFASQTGDTTYTITLTATNSCGSVDSLRTITVHPAPTAHFGPDFNSGCFEYKSDNTCDASVRCKSIMLVDCSKHVLQCRVLICARVECDCHACTFPMAP